jgi:hypothetical protein
VAILWGLYRSSSFPNRKERKERKDREIFLKEDSWLSFAFFALFAVNRAFTFAGNRPEGAQRNSPGQRPGSQA